MYMLLVLFVHMKLDAGNIPQLFAESVPEFPVRKGTRRFSTLHRMYKRKGRTHFSPNCATSLTYFNNKSQKTVIFIVNGREDQKSHIVLNTTVIK
jgi:hypothetical protein